MLVDEYESQTSRLEDQVKSLEKRLAASEKLVAEQAKQLAAVQAVSQTRLEQLENAYDTLRSLELILESMGDGLIVADSQGNVSFANAAAARLLNVAFDGEGGCRWDRCGFVSEIADDGGDNVDTRSSDHFPLMRAIRGETVEREELLVKREDGGDRWLSVNAKPLINREGGLDGGVMVFRDISDRKQAEDQLRHSHDTYREQAHRLETTLQTLKDTQAQLIQTEKMSSLGLLVAGIAHEVNNPIHFIAGNIAHLGEYFHDLLELIEVYEQHAPEKHSEQGAAIAHKRNEIDFEFICDDLPQALSSVRMGTDRVRQIVVSLRNFSRLDESDRQEVNLHDALNSTLVILQHRLRDQKTSPRPSIDVVKSYGELTAVNCYPGLLNQVFMNLISNAIDAIDDCYVEDGTEENLPKVAVSSPQIEILTDQLDENWVRIQVRDSGQGLPEEFAERLFDPFFTTKSVGQGTGLGLSIAHKIVVERHGGRISGRSLPSHGAEFTVDLPIGVMDGQAASSDTALGDMTPVDQLGDRPMEMTAGA